MSSPWRASLPIARPASIPPSWASARFRPFENFLKKTELALDDIDLIELNEAFAAQVLACQRELDLDLDRLNVNGGAIALGHPIGATGARVVVTLVHEMRRRKAKRGIATLCISGGMGLALLVEAL